MEEKKISFASIVEKLFSKEKGVSQTSFLSQSAFLKKYNISEKDFRRTKIKWVELENIYKDYLTYKKDIENLAKEMVDVLLSESAKNAKVHSVRYRIKNPDSLIEKIIRKKIESIKKKKRRKKITIDNYFDEVTDLIGIRVLHAFKSDWKPIHTFISSQEWILKEPPKVHYRKGDAKEFLDECKKCNCDIERPHPKGYRSIHYIIKRLPKNICFAEVQVRTIFEEGWSEIDHKLRYFTKSKKEHVLDKYSLALNRVAGSADEIGTIMNHRHLELQQADFEKQLKGKKKTK